MFYKGSKIGLDLETLAKEYCRDNEEEAKDDDDDEVDEHDDDDEDEIDRDAF